MSLLELSHVSKRRRGAMRDRIVLRDVSLEVDRGEYVVIWGQRGSGRPTLLGVAAGIEGPDTGTVCFQGSDLAASRGDVLGEGIGYCPRRLRGGPDARWRTSRSAEPLRRCPKDAAAPPGPSLREPAPPSP